MTTEPLLTRVIPPLPRRWRGRYVFERNVVATKSYWPVYLSGFFDPLFYLLAIGVGVGRLTGDVEFAGMPVEYAAFVAPAMLAASAMNGAVYESTNMFFKLKYAKTYDGILATPLGARDVATGEIAFSLARGAVYSLAFLLVMAIMGLISSPWGVLALPAAILIGFAFGAAGTAATTYMRSWQDLDLVTLVTLPLFLFSTTLFPIDVYPEFIQVVVWLTPLYHGVALTRGLTLGVIEWTMLVNVAYLATMGIAGSIVTARRVGALLLK